MQKKTVQQKSLCSKNVRQKAVRQKNCVAKMCGKKSVQKKICASKNVQPKKPAVGGEGRDGVMDEFRIHESVFRAEGSRIVRKVALGRQSSVWYNAVLRGDEGGIRIGERTNVQDNTVIHAGRGFPVVIGDDVTIGHSAIVHGCTVGDCTLIGMGAVVMNGAVIGSHCLIGAGSLVIGGTVIPDGSLVMGRPAKVVRQVTEEQIKFIQENADHYVRLSAQYIADGLSV